ncbi:MAG: two-component regulator propeller domain-containing protein [Sedimenticola sp.]
MLIMKLFLASILVFTSYIVGAISGTDTGNNPPIIFNTLTTKDGLSHNNVTGVVQDDKGFMWFSTFDGLNRYDGYEFKVYRHDSKNSRSLTNNQIRRLFKSRNGDLWIGTWGSGLNRFDSSTETFYRYVHDPQNPESLSHNLVWAIHEDQAGMLWVGTRGGGLNRLDPATGIFKRYSHNPSDSHSLASNSINAIFEDQSGVLWVGTENGLSRLDRQNETFTHFQNDPNDQRSLNNNSIKSLTQDQDGTLWVGTDGGLHRLDGVDGGFTRYLHDSANRTTISHNQVEWIHEGREGKFWVATYGGGLNLLDRETGKFTRFQYDSDEPTSIGGNVLFTAYMDNLGGVWAGSYGGGVSYYSPHAKPFKSYIHKMTVPSSLSANKIRPLHEDRTGRLWVGTLNKGLNRLDKKAGEFTRYLHDPNDPESLSSNNIRDITDDRSGQIWIATFGGGLNRLDPESGVFTRYQHNPGNPQSLSANKVYAVFEDSSGVLWVGTWTQGLEVLDRKSGTFTHYPHNPDDPNSISHNSIVSFYEDHLGVLWIGTYGGGLNRYDRQSASFKRYQHDPDRPGSLSHNNVLYIGEDSTGSLWLATGGGLNRFDRKTESFKSYSSADGLPSDTVHGFTEDSKGNLWMSTSGGISVFNPETETFRNYNAADGLLGNQFDTGAFASGLDGVIYAGGSSGVNVFYPQDIKDNPTIPPVVITNIQLANKPIPIGEDSILKKSILETDKLTLSYLDQVISFEFAALDYLSPENNKYKYQLEGFDDTWNEVDSSRRFVTYTNLDAGEYRFRVIGSNNDGVWNEEGDSITITIMPPWWETWWAYVIYTFTGIFLVIFIIQYRTHALNVKKEELGKLVEERTRELHSSNKKLMMDAVVFQSTSEAIIITDTNHRIFQVNTAFCDMSGFSETEAIGNTPKLWRSNYHDDEFYLKMFKDLDSKGHWQGEIWNRRKNGSIFPVWESITVVRNERGEVEQYIAICSDISEKVHAEERIRYLAHYDVLTDLPNRSMFVDRFTQSLGRAKRESDMVALMFMDLDKFKEVNDTLGHYQGDVLLQQVAKRLKQQVRESDTISRLGGDEFTVIIEGLEAQHHIEKIAKKIIHTIGQPFVLDVHEVQIGISIGISVFPNDGNDVQKLIDQADIAMYKAKENGRNQFRFYSEEWSHQNTSYSEYADSTHVNSVS